VGRSLPLSGALEDLLPAGSLPRGSVLEVAGGPGAVTLALALASGPSRTGSWVGCVGFPHLGWEAAAEVGVRLDRLVAVAPSTRQWATVVAALLDAFDLVVCGPGPVPAAADLRRLRARARERGTVLVGVTCDALRGGGARTTGWPSVDARLRVEHCRWDGLGDGWGHLGARRLSVVAEGRGALSRPRRVEVVLGEDGRLHPASRQAGGVVASRPDSPEPEHLRAAG
jgi:hypothetical protein